MYVADKTHMQCNMYAADQTHMQCNMYVADQTHSWCNMYIADQSETCCDMQALQEASPHTHALVLSPRTLADALQDILRVGCAADVEAEALQLVDSLQARLRRVVGMVAKAKRPKVLSLEGLEPLVLGMLTSLDAEPIVTCACSCPAVCAQCKGCFCLYAAVAVAVCMLAVLCYAVDLE